MSDGWTRDRETRGHSGLIAHQITEPGKTASLLAPRRARCRAATYGGPVVELEGTITHAATENWLAFTADYPGWGRWTAWVTADACTPLPATCRRCADLGVIGVDEASCPDCGGTYHR